MYDRPIVSPTFLAIVAFAMPAIASAQSAPDPYAQLKAVEASFPRMPYEALFVGTFDARTGNFSGLTSSPPTKDCTTDARGKPQCQTEPGDFPVLASRAHQVALTFHVINHRGPVALTVNGVSVTAPANKDSITALITRWLPSTTFRAGVKWSLSADGHTHSDQLNVDRMSFGVGAFMIPVLPVAIVYDPPQDSLHQGVENFTATESHSTTVTLSLTSSHGSTHDVVPGFFIPINEFEKRLNVGSQAASAAAAAIPQLAVVGQALSTAAKVVQGLFGTSTGTQQDVATDVSGSSHQLTVTAKQSYRTAHLGPGKGDVFVYLQHVPVAWLADCRGPLSFTPLGVGRMGYSTVGDLQSDLIAIRQTHRNAGPQSKLDSMSIQGLLALDPFVAGGNFATLPPTRFDSLQPPFGLNRLPFTWTLTVTDVETQRQGATQMTSTMEKDDAGLLASTVGTGGFGPDSTGTFSTTLTQSNLLEQSSSETRDVSFTLGGPGLDTMTVNAYYDRVFGSVAIRIVPSGPDTVSGDIAASGGAPPARRMITGTTVVAQGTATPLGMPNGLAGHLVALTVGSRTYETRTDQQGHYVFRIYHNAAPTQATIVVGNGEATQSIVVSGRHMQVAPLQVVLR